jgi:hypothetical protein
MAEYIYLDEAEANRFRLADVTLPIAQHYAFEPYNTQSFANVSIPLRIPNLYEHSFSMRSVWKLHPTMRIF